MRYVKLGNHKAGDDMPDIRFHPSLPDYLLEALALLSVLALWGCILVRGLQGEAVDAEFYKAGAIAVGCFVLLFATSRCSVRHINFPFRLNRRNVAYQYVLVLRLCRVLNVCLCWMLFFSPFKAEGQAWAAVGFAAAMVLLAVSLAGYAVLAYRHR